MRPVYLPTTLEEVWDILDREPGARVYAGGTDLLVQLRRGLVQADCLVCLERVNEIRGVREDSDEISLGAGLTHDRIRRDPIVADRLPVLVQALECLASPPIRHMGTIGGNIVNASPAGDTLPPLYALEARVELRSRAGTRTMPLADFIEGPGITRLGHGEILTRVIVPRPPKFGIHHFEKVGRRKAQACAVASLAALFEISSEGLVEAVRLAWGSVGPTVIRSREIEDTLRRKPPTVEVLASTARLVEQVVSPIDDVRASAEYRRITAGNLVIRLAQYARSNGSF